MGKVIESLRALDVKCLPVARERVEMYDGDSYLSADGRPVGRLFEFPSPLGNRHAIPDYPLDRSILCYFLDGSRRTYRVTDVVDAGRYLPVVAGQVAVAVLARTGRRLNPVREYCRCRNYIAFPDSFKDDLDRIDSAVNTGRLRFIPITYRRQKDKDPLELGIASIMHKMQQLEVETVQSMSQDHLLDNDRVLVVDGPLRFGASLNVQQFRNVIGLSKSFRPSFEVGMGRGKAHVGFVASALGFRDRTSVFEIQGSRGKQLGTWFLRIRPRKFAAQPLEGVVKVECFATDPSEREQGLASERVDILSAHLIRERSVSTPQSDKRWSSHIYPIYQAEAYAKGCFVSDVVFKGVF